MKKIMIMAMATALTLASCSGNGVSSIIKKAKGGDAQAQLEYGRLLRTSHNGVRQNWEKAVEMLEKSAEQGNPDAQWELGTMYEFENHVVKDEAKAFDLYRKSADAGSPIGLYMVAHCYQHGIATEENQAVSDSLYKKAFDELIALAPQEDIYVLNFVGSAYYYGDGVAQDKEKAFNYYLISAEKGNPETQYKVGNCYGMGAGTQMNRAKAREWYHKSADQGYPNAIQALKVLDDQL